jgi:hypothetical protein
LFCEDFEAITLHEDTGPGNTKNAGGQNVYGPWYDDTGWSGIRGFNSYWWRTYGPMGGDCAWTNGAPTSPVVGPSCPSGTTCGGGEYRADDRWGASSFACADVLRDGEFDDETAPSAPVVPSSHSGVLDGVQSFAHRIPRGHGAGIGSDVGLPTLKTFGITMGVAYPENSAASGIWNAPWKHNQWRVSGSNGPDGPFLFHRSNRVEARDPFDHFMYYAPGKTKADCEAALSKATIGAGVFVCDGGFLNYTPEAGVYDFTRDWPFGRWGCARGYFENLGSSNVKIQIWFNDKLIIAVNGLDGSFLANSSGYGKLMWNSYSNMNQWGSSTNFTTYRYEDNIHVTAGPPISCNEIGFTGIASSPPPASGSDDTPGDSGTVGSSDGEPNAGGSGTSSSGTETLQASVALIGFVPTVTSTVSGGVGPYQFLFDCGAEGGWDGVQDTALASAQHTCASGVTRIRSWVWDRSTGVVLDKVVDTSGSQPSSTLGAPGKPVLVTN